VSNTSLDARLTYERGSKRLRGDVDVSTFRDFMQTKNILHTFNDVEIEILTRDKAEIKKVATELKSVLEETNPNIKVIAEFKSKRIDLNQK
jgi:hypothetical protein